MLTPHFHLALNLRMVELTHVLLCSYSVVSFHFETQHIQSWICVCKEINFYIKHTVLVPLNWANLCQIRIQANGPTTVSFIYIYIYTHQQDAQNSCD